MRLALLILPVFLFSNSSFAIGGLQGVPNLPTSGMGLHGSVGAGFTDFKIISPSTDFKLERGMYLAGTIEKSFNVAHLYLTLGLSYMDAEGIAKYQYTDFSSSTVYSLNDVPFRAKLYELSLGLKLKLIDDYWFKPYLEGGGLGSYSQITYDSASMNLLKIQGSDYKSKDVILGSGYYAEGGVEIEFTKTFGVKIAARQSTVQTKKLDTLGARPVNLMTETYYVSAIFGF